MSRLKRREFLNSTLAGFSALSLGVIGTTNAQTPAKKTPDLKTAAPNKTAADKLPTTGVSDPKLALFDELMQAFMKEHQPPGAALAVVKSGRLVYARGFGYADREQKVAVDPQSLFRIASLSKSLTSAAILRLVENGKLKLDAKVFDLLKIAPHLPSGANVDPRLSDVTVLHCLQHSAGWDRGKGFDPMGAVASEEIAQTLKIKLPLHEEPIIRYTFGRKLDFDPGTQYVYSNFGYCVLGRMIEIVSGQKYDDYVKTEILAPLGIRQMRLGKNLLADRAQGEVKYYDSRDRTGRAISGPKIGQPAPFPYGVESLETMDANGGWIASAVDLAKFITAFDDPTKCPILNERSVRTMFAPPAGALGHSPDGKTLNVYYACGWQVRPVDEQRGKWTRWHTGLLSGTSTLMVARADDIAWVVLFNSDADSAGKQFAGMIDPLLHGPANKLKDWPDGNLFDEVLRPE